MYKIGIIGAGNMSSAIVSGIINNNIYSSSDIIVSDKSKEALNKAKEANGVVTTDNNLEVINNAKFIILAIKPQIMGYILEEIKDGVSDEHVLVSIAPGKTLDWLSGNLQKDCKIIRCMPNTPASVLEGCTGYCCSSKVGEVDIQRFKVVFESIGTIHQVDEKLMDTVVGISGSSPAYVFIMIEAMADAAVLGGMPRQQAYEMAAQAVLGSAKMVLESGKHPGELKDMVCSPGGTTIEAVKELEEYGFRNAIIQAIGACIDRSRQL